VRHRAAGERSQSPPFGAPCQRRRKETGLPHVAGPYGERGAECARRDLAAAGWGALIGGVAGFARIGGGARVLRASRMPGAAELE